MHAHSQSFSPLVDGCVSTVKIIIEGWVVYFLQHSVQVQKHCNHNSNEYTNVYDDLG